MKYRRRLTILLVIASLLAGLIAFPASAEYKSGDIIYITAINNTLLELRQDTMPVKIKSQIYVPCSVFNSNDLGTFAYYSRETQIATVTNGDIKLSFDLSSGKTYDSNGKYYSYTAIYRNNTAYLPVYYVVDFYHDIQNINYKFNNSYDNFQLIRITRGDVLSDEDLYTAIQRQITMFLKSVSTPVPTESGGTTDTEPTAPVYTSNPTPRPTYNVPPAAGNNSGVMVYMTFLGIGERTADLLDQLDKYSYKACFFATAQQIKAYPDIARRINGTGHAFGILLGGSPAKDYMEASKVLLSAVRTAVFLTASGEKMTEEQLNEAKVNGLIVWSAEKPTEYSANIYTRLDKSKKRCDFIFDGVNPPSKSSVEKLLSTLKQDKYTVGTVNELTVTKLNNVMR